MKKIFVFVILCLLLIIVVYVTCVALSICEVKVPVQKNINDSLYTIVKIDTEKVDPIKQNPPFDVKHIWFVKK